MPSPVLVEASVPTAFSRYSFWLALVDTIKELLLKKPLLLG